MEYLSQAHKLKLQIASLQNARHEDLLDLQQIPHPRPSYLMLHNLVAIIACLETYLGGLTKPGAVMGITLNVAIMKLVVVIMLHYLTLDAERYHSWARNCHLALGAFYNNLQSDRAGPYRMQSAHFRNCDKIGYL